MTQTARRPSVKEIVENPATPQWIKDGVRKLRRSDPVYFSFLEAIHDYRIGIRYELTERNKEA